MGIINAAKFLVGAYQFAKAGGDWNTGELPKKPKTDAAKPEQPAKPTAQQPAKSEPPRAGWTPKK
jgi:hypothetical protein